MKHRKPLLVVPEHVHPHSKKEEKMTCHDSLVYAAGKKKRMRVNEGGAEVVQGAQTELREERSEFTKELNPDAQFVFVFLDFTDHLWSCLTLKNQ